MKRTRRTFSREYKLAAVRKVIEQGLSCCEVARDLDIRDTLINHCLRHDHIQTNTALPAGS